MKQSSIKVIAGTAKGTRLFCPEGSRIRPALARVKKSVFDIIRAHVPEASVADIFAGTGSIGIEALSRGAKDCVFVENDPVCIEVIRQNLNKVRFENVSMVKEADAFDVTSIALYKKSAFDIIFINPPYRYFSEPRTSALFLNLLAGIASNNILRPDGLILIEHGSGQLEGTDFPGLELYDRRDYDDTQVSFLRLKKGVLHTFRH